MLACTSIHVHASASMCMQVNANRTDQKRTEKNGTDPNGSKQKRAKQKLTDLIPTDVGFQKKQSSPIFGGWGFKY